MEELRQSLAPLNLNLLLSGCPLFVLSNKCLKVVSNLYAIWLLVGHICSITIFTNVRYSAETSILIFLTIKVWEFVYNGCANLTILTVWFSRYKLLEVLAKISCSLRPKNLRFLFRMSLVMLLHRILFIALFRGYYYFLVLSKSAFMLTIKSKEVIVNQEEEDSEGIVDYTDYLHGNSFNYSFRISSLLVFNNLL